MILSEIWALGTFIYLAPLPNTLVLAMVRPRNSSRFEMRLAGLPTRTDFSSASSRTRAAHTLASLSYIWSLEAHMDKLDEQIE